MNCCLPLVLEAFAGTNFLSFNKTAFPPAFPVAASSFFKSSPPSSSSLISRTFFFSSPFFPCPVSNSCLSFVSVMLFTVLSSPGNPRSQVQNSPAILLIQKLKLFINNKVFHLVICSSAFLFIPSSPLFCWRNQGFLKHI